MQGPISGRSLASETQGFFCLFASSFKVVYSGMLCRVRGIIDKVEIPKVFHRALGFSPPASHSERH